MKKQRSCVRMDELNEDQRKELNSRIKKTVEDFDKEITESEQEPEE